MKVNVKDKTTLLSYIKEIYIEEERKEYWRSTKMNAVNGKMK